MERQDILEMMARLELAGMRAAFDEVLTTGLKRKHSIQAIIADLLKAEIAEKQARSIKYQLTTARLPLAGWSRHSIRRTSAGTARDPEAWPVRPCCCRHGSSP